MQLHWWWYSLLGKARMFFFSSGGTADSMIKNWTLDNPEYGRNFQDSPVFDPVYGFGGNGAGGSVPVLSSANTNSSALPVGGCIQDGPFAGLTSNLGPGYSLNNKQPHCIIRNFQTKTAEATLGWTKNVVPLLKQKHFTDFTYMFDNPNTGASTGIHGGGHLGVNGEMANVYSSINDPLFFMHHAQLDHVWWTWQNLKSNNLWVSSKLLLSMTWLISALFRLLVDQYIQTELAESHWIIPYTFLHL
jgi:tyrosinase